MHLGSIACSLAPIWYYRDSMHLSLLACLPKKNARAKIVRVGDVDENLSTTVRNNSACKTALFAFWER